jgi:hypothetical protein
MTYKITINNVVESSTILILHWINYLLNWINYSFEHD